MVYIPACCHRGTGSEAFETISVDRAVALESITSKTTHTHVADLWVKQAMDQVPVDHGSTTDASANSDVGKTQLGSEFSVDLASGSGTFGDPEINFTVTTTNGKTFTFSGTVVQSKQMVGTISGPTHPASRLQLDKQ